MIFIILNFAQTLSMKVFKTILLGTVFLLSSKINAQQQVIKIDTISGTELTFAMDSRVEDALTDLEDSCERTTVSRSTRNNASSGSSTAPKRVLVANRELTTAEICRRNPRISGIKIQLAVVKSNAEANEVKAFFRRRFPQLKVETDASLRPNYKVLAGSYFTKQSAASDLAKIRQHFKSAIPVQYRVFCVEAK